MTLSRHFYEIDEVHAVLQYSSTRNDKRETIFWCYELLSSGYGSEAISTLFESWIWYKGPFSLSWLRTAQHLSGSEITESDILLSAYQLSWIPCERRDHSLWNILVLTAQGVIPDRVTPKTPPYLPSDNANEIYMVRALFQGKAYSAWWMSRHLSNERVWEILRWYVRHHCPAHSESYLVGFDLLENYESLLGYKSEEYDIIIRCLAVLSCCLNYEQQEQSWKMLPLEIEPSIQTALDEWDKEVGQPIHRRYSIPTACLYGRTTRGRMKWTESTISQLGYLEKNIKGCPFWDGILEEYHREGKWQSDDMRELFYNRYIAEHPDEWTSSEKQKSHGDGIMGPKEESSIAVYSKRFFNCFSRYAWHLLPIIQSITHSDTNPITIISLLQPPTPITDDILRPVRRRVCI